MLFLHCNERSRQASIAVCGSETQSPFLTRQIMRYQRKRRQCQMSTNVVRRFHRVVQIIKQKCQADTGGKRNKKCNEYVASSLRADRARRRYGVSRDLDIVRSIAGYGKLLLLLPLSVSI